jgi:hypothetical protein
MLSGVLRSPRAVAVNIEIMRAFVRLRGFLASQAELARKVAELEKQFDSHDKDIQRMFKVLKELVAPPSVPPREIGFHTQMPGRGLPRPPGATGRRRRPAD